MKKGLLLSCFLWMGLTLSLVAQTPDLTPWIDTPYGNQWIDYGKNYVRVGVTKDGIYKIPLSVLQERIGGTVNSGNIAAWFRGQQIALFIDNQENVVFYGRKNNGVSDGLLFRNSVTGGPDSTARLDKTTSFFSEEGSHFFSTSDSPQRMVLIDGSSKPGSTSEEFHTEVFVRNHSQWDENGLRATSQFAFSTSTSTDVLNHSFYRPVNAYIRQFASAGNGSIAPEFRESINLENYFSGNNHFLNIEYALHGNGDAAGFAIASVSPDEANLFTPNSVIGSHNLSNYSGISNKVDLTENTNSFSSESVTFGVKPEFTGTRAASRYGISFFKLSYSQQLDMSNTSYKLFRFLNNSSGPRRIVISEAPTNSVVYDISDPNSPKKINGAEISNSNLTIDLIRDPETPLLLCVVDENEVNENSYNIHDVDYSLLNYSTDHNSPFLGNQKINPEAFDYLIITHKDSEGSPIAEGAIDYAQYRARQEGGSYRTLTISTRNIYDQFNYGEPSPLAIGRFVDYMISRGIRAKHNVFLIGHAVSFPARVRKELTGEVPTFGDPGSDVLLIANLSNSPYSNPNIPAIPIGRLQAFEKSTITDYLSKVQHYESETESGTTDSDALSWRKNILHVVGAKRNYELSQFEQIFTNAESRMVDDLDYEWNIALESNSSAATSNSTDASITNAPTASHIESGIGALVYFGHGNQVATSYNLASVPESPNRRFPFLYITGCGVGNIYSSHTTTTIPGYWLNPSDKGAIAMVANSFKAYVQTADFYLRDLYSEFFGASDLTRNSIGQAVVSLAAQSLSSRPNDLTMISHINQTNVLGDPALRVLGLKPNSSLPVKLITFEGHYRENSQIYLNWSTAWEVNNDFFEIEKSNDGYNFSTIGRVQGKGTSEIKNDYYFIDHAPLQGINYYRLKQTDLSGGDGRQSSFSSIIAIKSSIKPIVSVYPNPTKGLITIETNGLVAIKNWKLFSIVGTLIQKGEHSTLNVESIPAGLYVVEVTTNEGKVTRHKIFKN